MAFGQCSKALHRGMQPSPRCDEDFAMLRRMLRRSLFLTKSLAHCAKGYPGWFLGPKNTFSLVLLHLGSIANSLHVEIFMKFSGKKSDVGL